MTYTKEDHQFAVCAYGKSEYLEDCITSLEKQSSSSSIIICTSTPSDFLTEIAQRHLDRFKLRNGNKVFADGNRNLRVKELALVPLRSTLLQKSRWIRRRVLSICDPICCPSVTYVKENLPSILFESHFASDLDWQAWEKLSKLQGSFCYIQKPLMGHRIHDESTTTKVIGDDNGRSAEDLEMYLKFWPRPIALLINRFYSAGQNANRM